MKWNARPKGFVAAENTNLDNYRLFQDPEEFFNLGKINLQLSQTIQLRCHFYGVTALRACMGQPQCITAVTCLYSLYCLLVYIFGVKTLLRVLKHMVDSGSRNYLHRQKKKMSPKRLGWQKGFESAEYSVWSKTRHSRPGQPLFIFKSRLCPLCPCLPTSTA